MKSYVFKGRNRQFYFIFASDYIRQNATNCHFSNSDSWVILSEIEQRIKSKIEAVGTPLKNLIHNEQNVRSLLLQKLRFVLALANLL